MLTVTKQVFYCEHCKRHRLTKNSIERHEPRCIYNPDRGYCGWHHSKNMKRPADYTEEFKRTLDLDWLRSEMNGCPACMLAVVVQADLSIFERQDCGFRYEDEVKRFRDEERQSVDLW